MLTDPASETPAVVYDPDAGALFVGSLKVTDKAILREAARWSTGERGEPVADMSDLAGLDLSAFAREALSIGARVLAIAAQSSDTLAVQQAVRSASDQVTGAVEIAVNRTTQAADEAVRRATETLGQTAREVQENLMVQVTHLVGGENPHLMERLRPILEKVGTDLESQVSTGIVKANEALRAETKERHDELRGLIHGLHRDLAVRAAEEAAAASATAAVKGVTTIKGFDFEASLHAVFAEIAAALGDEYQETGEFAGRLSRNKKGDGVLHVNGGMARVVIEAHDGTSKEWGSYLAEAERNRGAAVSIGVVRRVADNNGHIVRVIAPKRIVVAFDPADPATGADFNLMRTIVLLMRTVALTATGRFGTEEIATANEHIREALAAIEDLDDVKKSASAIHTNATKIEQVATRTMTAIQRELTGALNALTGASAGAASEPRVRGRLGDRSDPRRAPGDPGGVRVIAEHPAQETIQP